LGRGGISEVSRACGLSRKAIAKGMREIDAGTAFYHGLLGVVRLEHARFSDRPGRPSRVDDQCGVATLRGGKGYLLKICPVPFERFMSREARLGTA
jgi:hypothetical protein